MLADITIDLNQTTGLGAILALSVLVAIFTCPGKERSFWNKLNTVIRFPIWLAFMVLTLVMFFIGIIPTFAYHAKRELAFLFSIIVGVGTLIFLTFGAHPIWFIYGMAAFISTCIIVGELKEKYGDDTKASLDRGFSKIDCVEKFIRGNLFLQDEDKT